MMTSEIQAVYRGYRLQALYTLYRIADGESLKDSVFQPEGKEDLTIWSADGEIIEDIQVKAWRDELTLSDLESSRNSGFFKRAIQTQENYPNVVIRLVSFGPIGNELARAWQEDGKERKAIVKKLADKLGYSSQKISTLFKTIRLTQVEESVLTSTVEQFIRQSSLGIDAKAAFELLTAWLYIAAERKQKIRQADFVKKIDSIGRFVAERAAHHAEWFTTIQPIEIRSSHEKDTGKLKAEFYQGTATRFEHIYANLDVRRDTELQDIHRAFESNRVVIIHSASGQGKSALAYRFIHENYPENWRYEVLSTETSEHGRRVALALKGHADAIGVPMLIYIDVKPSDQHWTTVLLEIARFPNMQILITIREEDFRRASIPKHELEFGEIELALSETTAKRMYQSLVEISPNAQFPSFEDSWNSFGGQGPLLEYVYLITQGGLLRERLKSQVQRLRQEVVSGQRNLNELALLSIVSVASAYSAKVDAKKIAAKLELLVPRFTIDSFEKEYLLRYVEDERYIEGFHPVRSSILSELLTDDVFAPLTEVIGQCISLIDEADLEAFLLHCFSRHYSERENLLKIVFTNLPFAWVGNAGILNALLWLGVKEYIEKNKNLINDAFQEFGTSWWIFLDFDLSNVSQGMVGEGFQDLPLPHDKIATFKARQTPKQNVFQRGRDWLQSLVHSANPPFTTQDWEAVAVIGFWSGFLDANCATLLHVTSGELDQALSDLPFEIMCDVVYGLYLANQQSHRQWIEKNRQKLLEALMREMGIVDLEDDDHLVRAHFVLSLGNQRSLNDTDAKSSNPFHAEALRRIELLRRLYPDHTEYGCQGYGHRIAGFELDSDPTTKSGIPSKMLYPKLAIRLNAVFRNLGQLGFRPDSWELHAVETNYLRQQVVSCFENMVTVLCKYFESAKSINLFQSGLNGKGMDEIREMTRVSDLLPKCALDEWGFADENDIGYKKQSNQPLVIKHIQLTANRYGKYVTMYRDYLTYLNNFLTHAVHVLVWNSARGRLADAQEMTKLKNRFSEQGIKTDAQDVAMNGLLEIVKMLPDFQAQFQSHFGIYFANGELTFLEQQERHVFRQLWTLFFQFALSPKQILRDARRVADKQASEAAAKNLSRIQSHIKKFNAKGKTASLRRQSLIWDDQVSLLMQLDVVSPLSLNQVFAELREHIVKAVAEIKGDLPQRVLTFHYDEITIVPTIRGKALSESAWRLPIVSLTSASLSFNINSPLERLVQMPIEIWNSLRIEIWRHEHLDAITQAQTKAETLYILTSHVADLGKAPQKNEIGQNVLQKYIGSQSSLISHSLNEVISFLVNIVNQLSEFTSDQQQSHIELISATKRAFDVLESIRGNVKEDGVKLISMNELPEWNAKIQEFYAIWSIVRVYWLDYLLSSM